MNKDTEPTVPVVMPVNVDRNNYACPACGGPTQSRAFSAGSEWCCLDPACDADGSYPDDVLPCFACGTVPKRIEPDSLSRQAMGAVVFKARGNYGSAVYDPMARMRNRDEWLEINICDACLRAYQRRVLLVETRSWPIETIVSWVVTDSQEEEPTRKE